MAGLKARASLVIAALGMAGAAAGQEQEQEAQAEPAYVEVVVTVGTRAQPRTAPDSAVPVDSIDAEALATQGSGDMTNLLRTTIPSYHVNTNPSRDAAALLRPVNLRGLAPDHTLVLVNNKRRHRGAVIQWISNGASDGAQGPDISAIPVSAIKRVEVLRDGASSQYGSDAIAGVVNFVLKDASDEGSVSAKTGVHIENTSEGVTALSGNIGFPLGDSGFLNLSAEYNAQSATDRSVQHPDAVAMAAVGVDVANPAKPWGDAEMDGLKTFANMAFDLSDRSRVYAFGNYTTRDVETAFFYRSPQGRSGVYQSGGNILIGGGAECKAKYDYPATAANVVTVRDLLRADDACFAFAEILPEGFTPAFGATMNDLSITAGMDGTLDNGLFYDLSVGYGRNNLEFYINETVNASYGPDTPRAFDLGETTQTDTNLHADFVYPADVGLASDLNVAFGAEWRNENFEITTGERASWDTGPFGADGFSARSNGFGGFNPASSGSWDRANWAAYFDLEVDMTPRWRLGGALRHEDFDGFGDVTTYKLASRLSVSPRFALRASSGTGFRAPTPGQQNANNLSTVVDSATGVFREQGTVASTNPVALQLGGRALDAERSHNYTFGAVFEMDGGLALTLDWFRIDVQDRIALSRNITVDADLVRQLTNAGVAAAADFQRIRYFTNDYNTTTSGIDVVLTHGFETRLGSTDLLVGYNRTSTRVERAEEASTISRELAIERGVPGSRFSIGATHSMDNWDLVTRYNYFGSWFDSDDGAVHDGYGYLDLSARYTASEKLSFSVGSDNVLDTYPTKANRSPSSGRLYPRYSPGGYNGRLVYGQLEYRFRRPPPPPPPVPPTPVAPPPEPPPPPPPPPEPPADLIVLFEFDEADIGADDGRRLASYSRDVRSYAAKVDADVDWLIVVEGHADERGPEQYNQRLGQRRADAVRAQLEGLGIDAARIQTISYGETRPAAAGADDAARAQNRRAVVICRER